MATWNSPHTIVMYEGESKARVKGPGHVPPKDKDGKPKKPLISRKMTPLEHMSYSKSLWAKSNAGRKTMG